MQSFKELVVWQRAMELAKAVYLATESMPTKEQYGLTNQCRRAAVSIPSNIAEGYGRKGRGEYVQFLHIARGSSAELETQLLLIKELYLSINTEPSELLLTEVQKMLTVLISRLKTKP